MSNVFKPHGVQVEALRSTHPITLLATGVQFGKSMTLAMRMKMFMHRFTDKNDNFIMTAPTYKILQQATLPPFLKIMDGYGVYHRQDAVFEMHSGGLCYMRTATDPDSIVGITKVRKIVGDECGLYSLYFWENLQARAAFLNCPITLGTSPYTLNWVYKDLIRPKQKDSSARADVLYLKARSIDNPYFNKDYYYRAQATMDERRFRAMFGGEWEKMDGLVYDCFDENDNMCQPFDLPPGTKFYAGVDWGTTAPFVFQVRAITPDQNHYQICEVYKTGLGITDMVAVAKQKMQTYPIRQIFCDPSGAGHILEFQRAGLPAVPANNDIKMGIGLHYELIRTRRFKLFRGDNKHSVDEYSIYHYPEDKEVKADTKVDDQVPVKQSDHACFPASTLIHTKAGKRFIDELVAGDEVKTPLGYRKVLSTGLTGVKAVATYRFTNNYEISATADHPIYVYRKGFIPLGLLTPRDIILPCKYHNISTITAGAIALIAAIIAITESFCISLSLRRITAKSQKAITFTTSTLIRLITPPTILRLCPQANICAYTGLSFLRRESVKEERILSVLANTPKLGTEVSREKNGTKPTGDIAWQSEKKSILSVSSAARAINQKTRVPYFARIIVGRILDAKVALMILTQNVLSAALPFVRINTLRQKLVRLCAVEDWSNKVRVYGLTVDISGSLEINGMLFSNCDTARYITAGTYTGIHRKVAEIHRPDEDRKLTIDERMARIREPSREASSW